MILLTKELEVSTKTNHDSQDMESLNSKDANDLSTISESSTSVVDTNESHTVSFEPSALDKYFSEAKTAADHLATTTLENPDSSPTMSVVVVVASLEEEDENQPPSSSTKQDSNPTACILNSPQLSSESSMMYDDGTDKKCNAPVAVNSFDGVLPYLIIHRDKKRRASFVENMKRVHHMISSLSFAGESQRDVISPSRYRPDSPPPMCECCGLSCFGSPKKGPIIVV